MTQENIKENSFLAASQVKSKDVIRQLLSGKIINRNLVDHKGMKENNLFPFVLEHFEAFNRYFYLQDKRLIKTGNETYTSFHLENIIDSDDETEVNQDVKKFKAKVFLCFLGFIRYLANNEQPEKILFVDQQGIQKEKLIEYLEKDIDFMNALSKLKDLKDKDRLESLINSLRLKGVLYENGNNIVYSDFGVSIHQKFKESFNENKLAS